jgi:hypothetical protein
MTDISEGLDLTSLDTLSKEEFDENLMHVWSWRGLTYEFGVKSMMMDANPKFSKIHRWGADFYGRPDHVNVVLLGIQNLHSYILLGWETGILNQFLLQRRKGVAKEQMMELVMFAQIYAGIRGMGHVVRAIGDTYPALAPPDEPPAPWPDGWAADPEAFRSGLDLSVRHLTDTDRKNLESWYERTLGYLPESVRFGLKYHPDFVKVNRAKWEVAIKTLPKQVVPWQMIRHQMMTGNADGLRETVALCRAWGISRDLTVSGITNASYYFCGFEGLYEAQKAVEELLDEWPQVAA